jgi:TRAP-type C4-dicarboxylate transport system substrate-binding protein
MNLGDVYTSLDQGVIVGADVTVELVTSYKFYESAKYYTETQHIMTPGMVVANLAWWKGLDASTQKLIEDVIATRFLNVNDAWFVEADPSAPLPEQQKALKLLVDRGVTIVKADLPALRKAAEPVFAKYKAVLGAEFVERTCAHVSLAGRELGFCPLTDLATGLARFVEWFRSDAGQV